MFWMIFLFYITPGIITYLGMRNDFKNLFPFLKPEVQDVLIVLSPIINIGFSLIYIIEFISDGFNKLLNHTEKTRDITSKFFRL
ncbi:hypothetical protein [Cytobacillus sp.]|uniref:hypothetical protein n=1 Tax=Cytobacillus sp. TaxID=2675269 RepID=UPI0028BECDEB|nr:hypothetical protein [Cytobacillus sp.]